MRFIKGKIQFIYSNKRNFQHEKYYRKILISIELI
jgi:hypothetical protein